MSLVFAAVGCSERAGVALLCDAPKLDGWLRIDARIGGQSRVLEGTLRFDRVSGDLTFVRDEAGVEVVLERRGDGAAPRKSVGGEDVEVRFADLGDLSLLLSVLRSRPEDRAEVRPLDDGYVILGPGQEIRISYRAGASAGG